MRCPTSSFARSVTYLQAIIGVKKYASAKKQPKASLLRGAAERLGQLTKGWHEQAERDLRDALTWINPDAPDSLSRHLALARFLKQLELRDPLDLGKNLLDGLRKAADNGGLDRDKDVLECGKEILAWDPSSATELVKIALKNDGLAWLTDLANGQSVATKNDLLTALLGVANKSLHDNEYDVAWNILDAARRIDN